MTLVDEDRARLRHDSPSRQCFAGAIWYERVRDLVEDDLDVDHLGLGSVDEHDVANFHRWVRQDRELVLLHTSEVLREVVLSFRCALRVVDRDPRAVLLAHDSVLPVDVRR